MVRVALSIIALFVSLILLITGNAMLGTLLAVRLDLEGIGTGIAGLVLALYAVGFVLGSLFSIRIVRRVGHIRSFAAFAGVTAAAVLLHPLLISVPVWMLLRVVVGFCVAGLMLITESWVNARATAQTRGALLALYMLLFYSAAAGGQFLLAVGDPAQFQLFSLVAILIALSLVPLSVSRTQAPELVEGERIGLRAVYRKVPLGIISAVLSGIVVSAFSAIGPIYASQVGLPVERLSVFMGISVLAAMAFQWPIGLLSDYIPRARLILGLALVSLVMSLLAALLGAISTFALFTVVPLFVGLTAALYPVSLALTHDHLNHSQIVPASATLLLSFGVGTMLGPLGSALLMGWVGPSGLFLFTAGVLVVLILVAVRTLRAHDELPVAEQEHCVTLAPVSTPLLMELDPRNEAFETTHVSPVVEKEGEGKTGQGRQGHPAADEPKTSSPG